MSVAAITLQELTFPDITGKTIKMWGQVEISAGTYTTGGLVMGLIPFIDGKTVDFNAFLRCDVWDEEPQGPGSYVEYHYSPVGDVLQIFVGGVELANGANVPVSEVLINPDAPAPQASPRQPNLLLFEATFDRTCVRG